MGKRIGYGKIGRSMPLALERCGNLGGDVEMVATLKSLADRHPDDTFILVGRNTGEDPREVGLPPNVENPWIRGGNWHTTLRKRFVDEAGPRLTDLTIEQQQIINRIYGEVTTPTFVDLDAIVMWIGQHGTSNSPVPKVDNPTQLTKPQDWCAWYASYIFHGINAWQDVDPWRHETVWLNADPRNYIKWRDIKWPQRHPVLTQFLFKHDVKHVRYGDVRPPRDISLSQYTDWSEFADPINTDTWVSTCHNTYARLEVNALMPGTPFGDLVTFNEEWHGRDPFGIVINETRKYVHDDRKRVNVMNRWVMPLQPAWIHGTWTKDSMQQLGREIVPIAPARLFEKLATVRCTFTTPASGTGWATAKPWEAFAAGVVCFFHPEYDTQNNILGDAPQELRDWLRVKTPDDLRIRVGHLSQPSGRGDWLWLVRTQREHFEKAVTQAQHIEMIEDRIWP